MAIFFYSVQQLYTADPVFFLERDVNDINYSLDLYLLVITQHLLTNQICQCNCIVV